MDLNNSRILIADPDPDIGQTLQLYFETKKYEVKRVKEAEEIVSSTRQWQPSAILVSTEFAGGRTFDICSNLLDDTLTGHIPIIMLLHLDDRQARLEALEVGVDHILTKPIDIEELQLRVEAAIRLSTMRQHI